MTGRFEIANYIDPDKILDTPKVVVTDGGPDNDMIYIKIRDEKEYYHAAKVVGKDLIKAVERCMNLNSAF